MTSLMPNIISNTSLLSDTSSLSMKSSAQKTDSRFADMNARDWMSLKNDATITISCRDILDNAREELEYLQKLSTTPENDLTPLNAKVLEITEAILKCVIRDNSPTPQFAPHQDGSIDIQWWVGDQYLIITVEPFMISFAAWDNDYLDIFAPVEVVFDKNDHVDDLALAKLYRGLKESEKLLQEMSSKVTNRRPKRV